MLRMSDIPTYNSYDIANSIQGDSGRQVIVLGTDSVGHCEKNILHDDLILNVYRDKNCFSLQGEKKQCGW